MAVPELTLSFSSFGFVPGAGSLDTVTAFLVPILEWTLHFAAHSVAFLCTCSSLM